MAVVSMLSGISSCTQVRGLGVGDALPFLTEMAASTSATRRDAMMAVPWESVEVGGYDVRRVEGGGGGRNVDVENQKCCFPGSG